jgi:signal transduction histidine kinase
VVSHELRTPLTSIRSALGVLMSGRLNTQPAKSQRLLEIAFDNSNRQVRLLDDILDLERIKSGKVTIEKKAL